MQKPTKTGSCKYALTDGIRWKPRSMGMTMAGITPYRHKTIVRTLPRVGGTFSSDDLALLANPQDEHSQIIHL